MWSKNVQEPPKLNHFVCEGCFFFFFLRNMSVTCSLLFCCPPFALSIHVGAERPGEVLIHHAADVSMVVGEEDAARGQVLRLGGLLLLLGALSWP